VAWLSYLAAAQGGQPLSGADIVQYVITAVNLGVLGIVFWLFVQGKIHSDSEIGRLTTENTRLIAEKAKSEDQRDEALKVAREDIVPLLTSFTATTSALLPLLQDLVRRQEERRGDGEGYVAQKRRRET
jgi:hypothetical protein